MKLIAGLGNPGRAYSGHRHNAGFCVVDVLADRHGVRVGRKSFGALIGSGAIEGEEVILVKPQTFMNLSGDSVAPLLGYYKLVQEDLIVVHDDIDLEFGQLKIGKGMGHGGHNGVRSIVDTTGDSNFYRVRIGVGRPPGGIDGADYVLSPFDSEEEKEAVELMERAADAVEMLLKEGLKATQQKYHA